ncbi:hypothetical protein E6C27_scaffold278G001160 [Cucumis melo var. makuwa]|uniref:Uncharacterized protein n=1 Tax=Cucumis melo var. makuwa TaxID=1194695 RepID=A0A5A7T1Q7_CUCMM|nr:hypothetical protein E6C27_scaffold278G001160 [Cucumis melo var. makuwa]
MLALAIRVVPAWVSSRYTKDQFVLGVLLGSPKTRHIPKGSQIAHVRERASSGVPLFRTLIESEGKGRGKLANDKEGSVTYHMGTQFCFRGIPYIYGCRAVDNVGEATRKEGSSDEKSVASDEEDKEVQVVVCARNLVSFGFEPSMK